MGFDSKHIRPLAVTVVRKGNEVLGMECFDIKKNQIFYRLLGGGIEFGETAEEAVVREWKEELGLDIKIISQLGVEENIFIFEGNPGHEIVFFFEVELANQEDYDREFKMCEEEHAHTKIKWIDLGGDALIYPAGFRKFI